MFVWAKVPERYKDMKSLEFSKLLLNEAKVAVSPGIGFGEYGDDYVRMALVENEKRIRPGGLKVLRDCLINSLEDCVFMDKINVGLIGFGTVGSGVVKILNDNAGVIRDKVGLEIALKRIADKDTATDRGVNIGSAEFTGEAGDILSDPDIDIVVELVGGTGIAKDFVLKAFENKEARCYRE